MDPKNAQDAKLFLNPPPVNFLGPGRCSANEDFLGLARIMNKIFLGLHAKIEVFVFDMYPAPHSGSYPKNGNSFVVGLDIPRQGGGI